LEPVKASSIWNRDLRTQTKSQAAERRDAAVLVPSFTVKHAERKLTEKMVSDRVQKGKKADWLRSKISDLFATIGSAESAIRQESLNFFRQEVFFSRAPKTARYFFSPICSLNVAKLKIGMSREFWRPHNS
jgi:hypothetical protein